MLQRQGDRLTRLVNEILDGSDLTGEPPALKLESMSLREVAGDVLSEFGESGAVAHARCPIDLRIDQDGVGRWHRSRVEQMISNLLDNALKFGAQAEVQIGVSCDGPFATFTVADHGIGIAEADQARIFERFERAVPVRNFGGLGLGLWIARRAAQALGGSIAVDSELGCGATFSVRLPLAHAAHS